MKKEKLFSLYESLHYKELDARDVMNNRLQISLVILLAYLSLYGYLLRNTSFYSQSEWLIPFCILLLISITFFGLSLYDFIKAFWGSAYRLLPTATEIEDYKKKLLESYEEEVDAREQLTDDIYDYYIECATDNALTNQKKYSHLHMCNKFLILNIFPMILAFIILNFSNIDKNSQINTHEIKIINPVKLEN